MISLPESVQRDVNNSFAEGHAMLVCVATPEGEPSVSFRGTAQALGDSALAFWVRRGGDSTVLRTIPINPTVVMVYSNMGERRFYTFTGRARIATDDATRNTVFDNSPELERRQDPERKGTCVVVDLTSVRGRGVDGLLMLPPPS
jgi:hypothetical protein